jgi:hypothetical protein
MRLYYLVDKWRVDKTGIIIQSVYRGDCEDLEYMPNVELRVFTEDQLFEENLLEKYDKLKQLHEYLKNYGRVFSIYSIETEGLPENFMIEQKRFYHILSTPNTKNNWVNIDDYNSYNSDFQNLNWKLERHVRVDTKKLKESFTNFPNDPHGDLKKLIDIICGGDHPDRLVRLNYLQKSWISESDTESARELCDILFDFTFGDYYDINAEGYAYYREMRYLRDRYNVYPERSKHDEPIN